MKDFEMLYNLMFSAIITPYNLLENAKLSNYSYVNYYKGDNGLIAEMECEVDEINEKVIFYYYFNQEDKLEKIYKENKNNEKELLFDRDVEIDYKKANLLKERINNDKKLNDVG